MSLSERNEEIYRETLAALPHGTRVRVTPLHRRNSRDEIVAPPRPATEGTYHGPCVTGISSVVRVDDGREYEVLNAIIEVL